MKNKLKIGIVGSGNIGCDLLAKVQYSDFLECSLFMGRDLSSKGMNFAYNMGINVSNRSIDALIDNPTLCDLVFDATTANSHRYHAEILKSLGKYSIDLTPSLIGKMCVPAINSAECLDEYEINMITCGGQATVPIVNAISTYGGKIEYVEIIASISSKSAGIGTRDNIDEFTQTTKKALLHFSSAKNAKAIIIINPAEPPILMRNTIYLQMENIDLVLIERIVRHMEEKIQRYVPGYKIKVGPIIKNDFVVITIEVVGKGDYLPAYSGNLDIITCAAIDIAEKYAGKKE